MDQAACRLKPPQSPSISRTSPAKKSPGTSFDSRVRGFISSSRNPPRVTIASSRSPVPVTVSGMFLSRLTHRYPKAFSAGWFAVWAGLLVSPLVGMTLPLAAMEAARGVSLVSFGLFLTGAGLLPVLLAGLVGSFFGPVILRLPDRSGVSAAVYGAGTALVTFAAWVFVLIGLDWLTSASGSGGGDVPGAAEVVGYMLVFAAGVGSGLVGAAAGVLLFVLARFEHGAGGR